MRCKDLFIATQKIVVVGIDFTKVSLLIDPVADLADQADQATFKESNRGGPKRLDAGQ